MISFYEFYNILHEADLQKSLFDKKQAPTTKATVQQTPSLDDLLAQAGLGSKTPTESPADSLIVKKPRIDPAAAELTGRGGSVHPKFYGQGPISKKMRAGDSAKSYEAGRQRGLKELDHKGQPQKIHNAAPIELPGERIEDLRALLGFRRKGDTPGEPGDPSYAAGYWSGRAELSGIHIDTRQPRENLPTAHDPQKLYKQYLAPSAEVNPNNPTEVEEFLRLISTIDKSFAAGEAIGNEVFWERLLKHGFKDRDMVKRTLKALQHSDQLSKNERFPTGELPKMLTIRGNGENRVFIVHPTAPGKDVESQKVHKKWADWKADREKLRKPEVGWQQAPKDVWGHGMGNINRPEPEPEKDRELGAKARAEMSDHKNEVMDKFNNFWTKAKKFTDIVNTLDKITLRDDPRIQSIAKEQEGEAQEVIKQLEELLGGYVMKQERDPDNPEISRRNITKPINVVMPKDNPEQLEGIKSIEEALEKAKHLLAMIRKVPTPHSH
jgi:hypothetical protein